MKKLFVIFFLFVLLASCRRLFDAPIPKPDWDLFNSPAAVALHQQNRMKMEAVYRVDEGMEVFGALAPAKWSYTVNGRDTTYHFSFFCEFQAAFIVCEGKRLDSSILLSGYWRKPVSTETGRVRLTIATAAGAKAILDNATVAAQPIIITGTYGVGDDVPSFPLRFTYNRPLRAAGDFEIVAHRGGGRTADLLPASENSVEIIRLAARYGATGVEIDVRMTKDQVPVLYHDITLNERLIQKNALVGPLQNYSYDQLYTLVRLRNGERIPALREALHTILYETPLRFVWLDIKYDGPLNQVHQLQQEFAAKAAAAGRELKIYIGIPDEKSFDQFLKLPNYAAIPSLNELEPAKVIQSGSAYWGPRWTSGLQTEEAQRMHALGKKVIPWTLDIPQNIEEYIASGNFDGILSNYPSSVAHYYYVRQ